MAYWALCFLSHVTQLISPSVQRSENDTEKPSGVSVK